MTTTRNIQAAGAMFFLYAISALCQTPQQQSEIKRLEEALLAPCCYSQAVGLHMSDAAEEMRREISAMVATGKDEGEIIEHYKSQYGERILIIPDGGTGQVLFALPVLLSVLAIGIVSLVLRKMLRAKEDSAVSNTTKTQRLVSDVFRNEIERQTGDVW